MNKNAKCSAWFRNLAIAAAVFPAAALCETNVTEDVVLTEDTDWRAEGVANISGTVNLNGHKLYTAGVAGSGLVCSANTNAYKYYRYKCDETGSGNFQVCEIEFLAADGTKITETPAAILWDSSGHTFSSYRPEKAFDGSLKTEWYDHRMADGKVWVTVEYSEPVAVAGYRWYTGLDTNDSTEQKSRNPVSWRLQASNDNENWTDLDVVTGAKCTTANKSLAYSVLMGEESELHVEISEGEVQANSTLKLSGPVKLVKDGAGTLVLSKSGQLNSSGVRVSSGILKAGLNGRSNNTVFGIPKALESEIEIEVESGGQFLDDIYSYGSLYNIHWVIAGDGPDGSGAIRTVARAIKGVNNASVAWGARLTLTDDAVINSEEYAFNFINDYYTTFYLELNGHTLNVTGKSSGRQWPYFLLSSVQSVGEGTLVMENLVFYPYKTAISQLVDTTVVISETASYYTDYGGDTRDVTISNLVYRSTAATAQTRQTTTVLGTYAPVSTVCAPKVVLGNASHLSTVLDLSERTTPFDIALGGGLTFASGSTVTVKTGSNNSFGKILAWSAPPEGISFRTDTPGCEVEVRDDGLYLNLRYFYIHIASSGESGDGVPIPSGWLSSHGVMEGTETAGELSGKLVIDGENGIPVWQSYCLGLDPQDAQSVVLCEAVSEQPADGKVCIAAKNLNVPSDLSGIAVTASLDRKSSAGWVEQESLTVSSGAIVAFAVDADPETALSFFV